MTRLIWPRADTMTVAGGPWASDVTAEHLASVHTALVPVLRLLLLIGYEIPGFAFRMPGDGNAWVRLDRYELAVTELADGEAGLSVGVISGQWDGPTVAIDVLPIVDARDDVSEMALEFLDSAFSIHDKAGRRLYLGYEDPSADLDDHAHAVLRSLEDQVRSRVELLIEDVTPELDLIDWTLWRPENGCGLYWLLDPQWWRPDALGGDRVPSPAAQMLESFAGTLHAATQTAPNVGGYFSKELTGISTKPRTPALLRRDPGTTAAVRHAIGAYFTAPGKVRAFFYALEAWLAQIGESELLPEHVVDELWDAPWFEVLVTLVDLGVFAPSALGEPVGEPPEPVEAFRWSPNSVELRVLGQLSIWLRRVRDVDGTRLPPDPVGPDIVPEEGDDALLEPIDEFAWDLLEPTDGSLPVLYLIAAPGVEIETPTEPQPDGWRWEIIRVPDAALVPEWGSAAEPGWLLPCYAVSAADTVEDVTVIAPGDGAATLPVTAAVQLLPQPGGVVLSYPVYGDGAGYPTLALEITMDEAALRSGDVRYAADVFYYADTRFTEPQPYLSAWVTPGVQVVIRRIINEVADLETWNHLTCHVWDVDDYADVPEWGTPLPFDPAMVEGFPFDAGGDPSFLEEWPPPPPGLPVPGDRFALRPIIEQISPPWWVMVTADIVVGAIPIVGDIVDAGEFIVAIASGTDRWGRPVTNLDLLLMGAGVLMPFVSSGLVRGMGRDVGGLFGGAVDDLLHRQPLATKEAFLDYAEIAERADAYDDLSFLDRTMVRAELELLAQPKVLDYAQVLRGEFASLRDLHKAAKSADKVLPNGSEVLRAFRHWAAHTSGEKSFRRFVEDRRWGARGRVRAIIEALCGNDVSVGTASRRKPSAKTKLKSMTFVATANPPAQPYVTTHVPQLLDALEAHVTARPPPALWIDNDRREESEAIVGSGSAPDYAARARTLLDSLSCGAGAEHLSVSQLGLLMGTKRLYLNELARFLALGIDLLTHDLHQRGRSIDEVLPRSGGTARVVAGLHKFFFSLVTGAAPEHAIRFEFLMIAQELKAGTAPSMLRSGAVLPGLTAVSAREGPDVLRYRRLGATRIEADVLQGKSFSSMEWLFAADVTEIPWLPKGPGGTKLTPEEAAEIWVGPPIFAQTVSDLLRMAGTTPPYWLEGPAPEDVPPCPERPAEPVRFSGQIEFWIDVHYYYRSRPSWRQRTKPRTPEWQRRLDELRALEFEDLLNEASGDELQIYLDELRSTLLYEEVYEVLELVIAPAFADQINAWLADVGSLPQSQGGLELPKKMRVTLAVKLL